MAAVTFLFEGGDAGGWHLTTAIWITPFIALAPLIGYFSNALPRQRVLVVSATYALVVVLCYVQTGMSPVIALALVALGAAVFNPVRYAVLPAAALACRWPLPRVNGWMEMGNAAAIVIGALLGVQQSLISIQIVLVILNWICVVSALPVRFPSDTIRPESPARAISGFFTDCGRVFRDREARSSLLALASFQAVVTAGAGVLLTVLLHSNEFEVNQLVGALVLVGVGAAAGSGVAALQGHPRRCLGWVPFGATGLLLALVLAIFLGGVPPVPCFLLGFMGGLVNVPLRSVYLAAVPADARGNASAVMNALIYVVTTALALVVFGLIRAGILATPAYQFAGLAIIAAAGAVLAWFELFPHALEIVVEFILLFIYRIRAHGPGAGQLPARGPLLIVANHAAYLDPFWLSKVMPRQVRPMMTSVFYDQPVVRWLSRHVARAIRVPAGNFRREAPELDEAIAALRAGECVVIFPEGMLRRTDESLLRPFGRGVWHILHELPDTPVCACWIEGSWGSFFSYKDGLPCRNKPFDRHRAIDVALSAPRPLAAELLADHHATRAWLRQAVLDCRAYLGLPPPSPTTVPAEPTEEHAEEAHGGKPSSSN